MSYKCHYLFMGTNTLIPGYDPDHEFCSKPWLPKFLWDPGTAGDDDSYAMCMLYQVVGTDGIIHNADNLKKVTAKDGKLIKAYYSRCQPWKISDGMCVMLHAYNKDTLEFIQGIRFYDLEPGKITSTEHFPVTVTMYRELIVGESNLFLQRWKFDPVSNIENSMGNKFTVKKRTVCTVIAEYGKRKIKGFKEYELFQ